MSYIKLSKDDDVLYFSIELFKLSQAKWTNELYIALQTVLRNA